MISLSLWRPWDFAMLNGKNIENRSQKPWPKIIGTRIALHAAKKYDYDALEFIKRVLKVDAIPERREGVVFATTRVVGWIATGEPAKKAGHEVLASAPELLEHASSPWFFGPYGWVVEDTIALPKPVATPGKRFLWELPPNVELEVLRQEASASIREAQP